MATTANGWPYVLPTDTVTSYPTTSLALADKLELLGSFASGTVMPAAPASVPGASSVAVTFPAGRFTAAPAVVASAITSNLYKGYAMPYNPTASGVTLYWQQENGAALGRAIHWIARLFGGGGAMVRAADDDGVPTVDITITCPTAGCENQDIPIVLTVPSDVSACQCGPCGTDLSAQAFA